MNKKVRIDKFPSIKTIIKLGRKSGRLYLSSLYGSYNIKCDFTVPIDEIVQFFCPHCNSNLNTHDLCEQCRAQMVAMKIIGGGFVKICSRRGCKKHSLEFENLETELKAFYDTYSPFL